MLRLVLDNPVVASGKKRGYDGHAHAAFLKDLAGKMRTEPGLTPSDPIWIHQDGDKIHWTPACRQVLEDEKIRTLMTPESSATYSPDFNPVEELFGCAERRLQLKQARRFSTSREMTLSRFKQVCREEASRGGPDRLPLTHGPPLPRRVQSVHHERRRSHALLTLHRARNLRKRLAPFRNLHQTLSKLVLDLFFLQVCAPLVDTPKIWPRPTPNFGSWGANL